MRDIRRDHEFEAAAAKIQPDVKRFDEQLEGVEWGIAKAPELFQEIPGTRLRVAITNAFPSAGIQSVAVFFTIDDQYTCTLRYVEPIVDSPEED